MRTSLSLAIAGLVGAALARPATALADFQGECPVDQIGQPCNNQLPGTTGGPFGTPTYCAASECETIVDELNDAGEDVGVPATCSICGACVPFCSDTVPCPSGTKCTGGGMQGFGWGPPSNPDQTTLWFPYLFCTDFLDASPADTWTPNCDGVGDGSGGSRPPSVDASGGVPSGDAGSPGEQSGASGSGGFDGVISPPADTPSSGAGGAQPPDAGSPSSTDGVTVLRSNSCAFGLPGVPPAALLPLGAVLGLFVVRRRSAGSRRGQRS